MWEKKSENKDWNEAVMDPCEKILNVENMRKIQKSKV